MQNKTKALMEIRRESKRFVIVLQKENNNFSYLTITDDGIGFESHGTNGDILHWTLNK